MQSIWIEIPAIDLHRAKSFYESVFLHEPTPVIVDGERQITVIDGSPTVSLNQVAGFDPGTTGPLPYFHLEGSLTDVLDRVARAGGKVIEDAHARGENGFFSQVQDSEGNAIYLHTASG